MTTVSSVFRSLALTILLAGSASAAILPGFSIQPRTQVPGFLTSLAFDQNGVMYASSTEGSVYRIDPTGPTKVAVVPTAVVGNADLLGIVFDQNNKLVAHYVTPDLVAEVIARVDLTTGTQTQIARFLCNKGLVSTTEHHGGNLSLAPDGSIYVGFGDFGVGANDQLPDSPAGRIFRIAPDGTATAYASGLRNPYGMAWDQTDGFLIASDNGPSGSDEIDFVHQGDNDGWPETIGSAPQLPGTTAPVYLFQPEAISVAPTGVTRIAPAGALSGGGFMVTTYAGATLFFFPSTSTHPFQPPLAVVSGDAGSLLDVVQNSRGEIFFASANTIWQLIPPQRGDLNGDGVVDQADLVALARLVVQNPGAAASSSPIGADVNGDGVVDARDLVALAQLLAEKKRAIRR